MKANGYSSEAIAALWETMVPFSAYGFNKSHAAAYGVVSYWTAYLKAHYPAEYMAALLESVRDDKDKSAIYLAECRRMGIHVLPPDVNESQGRFTPVGSDIRFGLGAIRNVGNNVVAGIVEARQEHGRAKDFNGFLDQVPAVVCNKRVIESLIKAGAFDSMGHTRRGLMEVFEQKVDEVVDLKRNQANGQDDLFGEFFGDDDSGAGALAASPVPELPEWEKMTRLAFEREMLGLYVSDHPLQGLEHVLAANRDVSIAHLGAEDGPKEGTVTICGMITGIQRKQTKDGKIWAILTVEDLEAAIEVMVFNKAYSPVAMSLGTDVVVRIRGRLRERDESVELTASDVSFPDVSTAQAGPGDDLVAHDTVHPRGRRAAQVHVAAASRLPGGALRLVSPQRATVWRLDDRLRVQHSGSLVADLKALLGPSSVSA
jgi:DNA polymerase-3 subunit alpha